MGTVGTLRPVANPSTRTDITPDGSPVPHLLTTAMHQVNAKHEREELPEDERSRGGSDEKILLVNLDTQTWK